MDELQRSLLNVFTYSDLDRQVRHRKNKAELCALQSAPCARYLVFHQNRFLLQTRPKVTPYFLKAAAAEPLQSELDAVIFLGSRRYKHYFAIEVTDELLAASMGNATCQFLGLREVGRQLHAHHASMLSYAKAIFNWHARHRFCGVCGADTSPDQGGHLRQCSNTDCRTSHFPRTDPAIIVSVIRDGYCLFGRQSSWPPKRFSVIAGFVEPGESIEQTVAREVHEETNIDIDRIYYHSSQPWPFPGSIMLGYSAMATSQDINLNDGELQEAHWRTTADVVRGLARDEFRLPTPLSIAYRLIEDWFNAHSDESLASVINRLNADRAW